MRLATITWLASGTLGMAVLAACSVSVSARAGSNSEPEAPAQEPSAQSTASAQPAELPAPSVTAAPSAAPAASTQPSASAAPTTLPPEATSAVQRKGAKILLPAPVAFSPGSAAFAAGTGHEATLGELKKYLEATPAVTQLRVEGHAAAGGDPAGLLQLSGQRALAVKQWLLAAGIDGTRVVAVGFGATKPIAQPDTATGQAQNERLAFRIAKYKGRNYLGLDPLGGGTEFK